MSSAQPEGSKHGEKDICAILVETQSSPMHLSLCLLPFNLIPFSFVIRRLKVLSAKLTADSASLQSSKSGVLLASIQTDTRAEMECARL